MKRRATLVAGILVFGLLADLAGRWSGIQARPRQTSSQGARYDYQSGTAILRLSQYLIQERV